MAGRDPGPSGAHPRALSHGRPGAVTAQQPRGTAGGQRVPCHTPGPARTDSPTSQWASERPARGAGLGGNAPMRLRLLGAIAKAPSNRKIGGAGGTRCSVRRPRAGTAEGSERPRCCPPLAAVWWRRGGGARILPFPQV